MPAEETEKWTTIVWILSEWEHIKRFIVVLIALVAVVGIASYIFFHYALTPMIRGGPAEFSVGPAGVILKTSAGGVSKIATVITVPACRLENYTGIWLTDGDTVEIKATGFVDTGNFFDWNAASDKVGGVRTAIYEILREKYDLPAPGNSENSIHKIAKDLFFMQLLNEYRFTWRQPDGKLAYPLQSELISADKGGCYKAILGKMKAHDTEYGCLLGYLAYDDPKQHAPRLNSGDLAGRDFPDGDLDPKRVFKIGHENVLVFSGGVVSHNNGNKISISRRKVFLCLFVNDCVVKKADLETLCQVPGHLQHGYKLQMSLLDQTSLLQKEASSVEWQRKLRELWYLDNSGSFTVVIEKKQGS
jgi:hypothetical protein